MRFFPPAALALLALLVPAACSSTVGGPGQTCNDFCGHVENLSCGQGCLPACAQAQQSCERAGEGNAFRALLGCYASASFVCESGALATNDCADQGAAVTSCIASATPPPPIDGGSPFGFDAGGGDGEGGSMGGPPDSSLWDAPSTGDTGPVDAGESACGQKQFRPDCISCCDNFHFVGLVTFDQAMNPCACSTPGVCATQCASSYCASTDPIDGDPCDQCLRQSLMSGGACYQPVIVQACDSQPDCVALLACITNNGCDAKP